MNYHDIPVVLVVAGKKVDYIPYVVKKLSLYCGFNLFYVVCPKKDVNKALRHSNVFINEKVVVVDEEIVVPGLNLAEVKKTLNLSLPNWPENHLPGWYLQQFLKMGFANYASDNEYFLIWDSDTLLTRPVSFFDGDKILFTQGNEYHGEYFSTIKVLFKNIALQSASHISQHLMVRSVDMIELINSLNTPEHKWWKNILLSLKGKTPFQFSEYETYTNYCLAVKPGSYSTVKRDWFRYGRSYYGCNLTQADIKNLSKLYDFVAFEDWDTGLMRRVRSYILVFLRLASQIIKNVSDAT